MVKEIITLDWWNRKRSYNIDHNPMEVLYGYKPESNR